MQTLKHKTIDILRWSEKYTKTDMVYLARGGFWTVYGQAGTFVASFLLVWAFAHFLSPETYGTYKFALSIFAILSLSTLPGVRTALSRATARGMTGSLKFLTQTQMCWGLIGMLGAILIAAYYYFNGNNELALLFLIVAPFVPFLETFANYETYLLGLKDFKTKAIYQILQRSIISVCSILIIVLSDNIYLITGGYLAIFTLAAFWFNKRANKKHPQNEKIDHSSKSYGLQLTGMDMLSVGAQHLDKILLFHYVGPTILATYFFALALPNELRSLFGQINSIAFPKFSNTKYQNAAKALPKKLILYIIVLTVPTTLYIVLAPYLFSFFFPQYLHAVVYSQALAPLILFTPIMLIHYLLVARGKTKALYIINIVGPSILIISLLVLLPSFAIWGAITSLYIKEIVLSIVYGVLLIREMYQERESISPPRSR